MLGMFARSFTSFPVTFDYVAQAEAPEGKADVLDVKGPANFAARLFVNAQTHLPIMVSWRTQAPPARAGGPGGPPGQRGPEDPGDPEDLGARRTWRTRGTNPAAPAVENRIYFADYRDVDGLKLPFRLRRAVGSETTEETTFDRFRINARIDPRRFEVGN